jgi:hypothetical protein
VVPRDRTCAHPGCTRERQGRSPRCQKHREQHRTASQTASQRERRRRRKPPTLTIHSKLAAFEQAVGVLQRSTDALAAWPRRAVPVPELERHRREGYDLVHAHLRSLRMVMSALGLDESPVQAVPANTTTDDAIDDAFAVDPDTAKRFMQWRASQQTRPS